MTLQHELQWLLHGSALFVFELCPLNILPVKADDGSTVGELHGWPAVLFPC